MIVGLTGGIASGKSTVSKMFKELGAEIIDADITETYATIYKASPLRHGSIENRDLRLEGTIPRRNTVMLYAPLPH